MHTIGDMLAPLRDTSQRWGSAVERETWARIRVAVAAYAYDVDSQPIMSDADFDALAASIDVSVSTARPDMDAWFVAHFAPHTGQWVHAHPDKAGLRRIAAVIRGQ